MGLSLDTLGFAFITRTGYPVNKPNISFPHFLSEMPSFYFPARALIMFPLVWLPDVKKTHRFHLQPNPFMSSKFAKMR